MSSTTCAVCDKRSQTVLCPRDRNRLVDALLDLAVGVTNHGERRPPSLLDALRDMAARLNRRASNVRTSSGGDGHPMPVNFRASRLLQRAERTITRWADRFAEHHAQLAEHHATVDAAAGWLAEHPRHLANWVDAAACYRAITGLTEKIRNTVDPETVFIGTCLAPRGDNTTCDLDIYVGPKEQYVRCPACGYLHNVEARRADLGAAIDDQLATVPELTRILPNLLGQPVKYRSLQTWARNGELGEHPPLPGDKAPRYRIGEARELAASKATREREKADRRTA